MGHHDGRVAMTAAASIQLHNGQKYKLEVESWVDDVRPSLALYLLLAVDDPKHAPDWMVGWMGDTGLLADVETWEPTKMVMLRLAKMKKYKLTSTYRHGAIVYRLLASRLVDVDPSSGRLLVKSPSLMWERVDMMARLYDEAVDRLWLLLERWSDE